MRIYRIAGPGDVDWANVDWSKSGRQLALELGVSPATITLRRSRHAPETRREHIDWGNVDWSKSGRQLSRELGVCPSTVSTYRSRHSPETNREHNDYSHIDWENIDWSKSTGQLSRELGVCLSTITTYRNRHAPETLREHNDHSHIDWENVDWTKSNRELANEMGANPSSVCSRRRKHAPETINERLDWSHIDWENVDWTKSGVELSSELSVPEGFVSAFRSDFAPHTLRTTPPRKYNWDLLDWNLSNRENTVRVLQEASQRFQIPENEMFTQSLIIAVEGLVRARRKRHEAMQEYRNTRSMAPQANTFTNWYKTAQSSRSFPAVLSRDEMSDFIEQNRLTDWQGLIIGDCADEMSGWSKVWKLSELPLSSFGWTANPKFKNKSEGVPPIVLKEDNGRYEVLDGKHRIGMAKARGEQTILVYLGDPDSWEQESTDSQNTKTASSVGKHKYTWVYIDLPKEIQKAIIDFGKQIDKEDLYVAEANKGLEDEPHITVKYGLTTENVKEVRECLEGAKKGDVYIGKSSIFSCDKFDVVKFTVESKSLNKLHEMLNRLPHEDKHLNYDPHATVAYVKKGKGKKYVDKFKIDKSFKIDKCFFGSNTKDYSIKLSFNLARFLKKANGSINLWLDDERDPMEQFWWKEFPQLEQGGWTWAKTVEEAQPIVDGGNVKFISFDNDLGTVKEGKHLAQWIEEKAFNNELNRMGWEVHSKNPIAGDEITMAMQNADRFWDGHENI